MKEIKCLKCGEIYKCPCKACIKYNESTWVADKDFNVTCKCGEIYSENQLFEMSLLTAK